VGTGLRNEKHDHFADGHALRTPPLPSRIKIQQTSDPRWRSHGNDT
jgi:hypothetical protein